LDPGPAGDSRIYYSGIDDQYITVTGLYYQGYQWPKAPTWIKKNSLNKFILMKHRLLPIQAELERGHLPKKLLRFESTRLGLIDVVSDG
jgi:hypothetical protein